MAKVKFTNAAKYKGTKHPAHCPFEVDDKDIPALVKVGAIVVEPPETGKKPIDQMKVDELKAYAKEHDIDISAAQRRDEIIVAIKAAEEASK